MAIRQDAWDKFRVHMLKIEFQLVFLLLHAKKNGHVALVLNMFIHTQETIVSKRKNPIFLLVSSNTTLQ